MSVVARASSPTRAAADRGTTYLVRLASRVASVRSALCLGVDPDPDALPDGFSRDIQGVERFALMLIAAAGPSAAAVKVNVAFFEAFGSEGVAALERVRAAVPHDLPFIADAKRGDIASTAARYATAVFEALDADAVTASPYLGGDAIAPLLEHQDRFVYVLCRTSNPGATELQDLDVGGRPLYEHVAARAREWAVGRGNVGLVVGATAPVELQRVRAVAPELPFLVPGVGAQGGEAEPVIRHGAAGEGPAAAIPGGGLLVNVSRGIAAAAVGAADPPTAVAAAAARWADTLRC
jgi:orotidine-5'-phosphate decarboxylase